MACLPNETLIHDSLYGPMRQFRRSTDPAGPAKDGPCLNWMNNYDSRYRDPNRDRDRNRRESKEFDPDSDSDFDFDCTDVP